MQKETKIIIIVIGPRLTSDAVSVMILNDKA
jgi:hypothetical protein